MSSRYPPSPTSTSVSTSRNRVSLAETRIANEDARKFWQSHFNNSVAISFTTFHAALVTEYGSSIPVLHTPGARRVLRNVFITGHMPEAIFPVNEQFLSTLRTPPPAHGALTMLHFSLVDSWSSRPTFGDPSLADVVRDCVDPASWITLERVAHVWANEGWGLEVPLEEFTRVAAGGGAVDVGSFRKEMSKAVGGGEVDVMTPEFVQWECQRRGGDGMECLLEGLEVREKITEPSKAVVYAERSSRKDDHVATDAGIEIGMTQLRRLDAESSAGARRSAATRRAYSPRRRADHGQRRRWLIILGVFILLAAAGAIAYFVIKLTHRGLGAPPSVRTDIPTFFTIGAGALCATRGTGNDAQGVVFGDTCPGDMFAYDGLRKQILHVDSAACLDSGMIEVGRSFCFRR
ncbi:hypothetical protein HK101_011382 [Irineochytrium annulatum]|nr:hypothetical protein HK101_011382 [Irineochytrium annulatum]